MTTGAPPVVGLVRRWAVEWLAARDPAVCREILAPSYGIRIGGFLLAERETYIAGTLEQLDRFPGLGITVHELVTDGAHVAVRCSEHGAAAKHGATARWSVVALFCSDGRRLTHCFAEEDYLSRRRQLATRIADRIEAPAPSPWTVQAANPDPDAERLVRAWLSLGELEGVDVDDSWLGHDASLGLRGVSMHVDALFSAGDAVAFHGTMTGTYAHGLDVPAAARGRRTDIHLAGLVHVRGGRVVAGRVIRDRLGTQRALARDVAE